MFKASHSNIWGEVIALIFFFLCGGPLGFGEEEICSSAIVAGEVASVLPGISDFLSDFLGTCLCLSLRVPQSTNLSKIWFPAYMCCVSPLAILMQWSTRAAALHCTLSLVWVSPGFWGLELVSPHSPGGWLQHPVTMLGPSLGLHGLSSGFLCAFATPCLWALLWVSRTKQCCGLPNAVLLLVILHHFLLLFSALSL